MELSQTRKLVLLRIALGIVYVWFGALKFFPETSPADGLAKDTMDSLFFGLIPRETSILLLATMEVLIGLGFLLNFQVRLAVYVALFHMVCTFTPLFFFPDVAYRGPLIFTLVGQYIMKNIVFVAAMLLILPQRRKT
ncbi:MAG: DoxX family membrane protein [Bacteroidetes bacterium]|nr:DoxX family membrane protein [Bacteroidota bacterium]